MSKRHWFYTLAALLLVAALDHVTPYEMDLGFLYLLPVGIAAWRGRLRDGLALAVLCAAVWLLVDAQSAHPYSRSIYRFWEVFGHLVENLTVACVLAGFRRELTRREQATARLREGDLRYRSYVDSAPDGVFVTDEHGRYLEVNPAACATIGASREELLGMSVPDLLFPEDREAGGRDFQRVVLEGASSSDLRYVRKDGAVRWWSVAAVRLSPTRFLGFTRDITETKEMEEALKRSEQRLKSLFEGMTEGVVYQELVYGPDGSAADYRILAVNPAYSKLLGFPADMAVGKLASELYGLKPLPYLRPYAQVVATGEPRQFEAYYPAQDKHFHLSALSLQQDRFAVIILDITDRKRAEDQVRHLNADLERQVQERTARLEAANREMEAFSYSVAHDLRSPLRAIDGFSHALVEDYGERLDGEGLRYLGRVRHGIQHMGMLIEDLLKLSRVSQTGLDRVALDLGAVAEQILGKLAQQDGGRQVQMVVAPGLKATGDLRLLTIALENLLGNAWKFTRKKSGARVEFGSRLLDGEPVFYVQDNGAGFEMVYADKLFTAFQRLHGPDEYEGSGIGLAIVERIIHRHGGRVWAEAETGQGATFYFSLPR